ncbi:hypothetical protein INR49_007071, partial [Caranx melampygus]
QEQKSRSTPHCCQQEIHKLVKETQRRRLVVEVKMDIYVIAFIIIATTTLTKGATECILSELAGAQQCFGASGEPFIFHLVTSANTQAMLIRHGLSILKVANHSGTIYGKYKNQSSFFTNGTFKLENVSEKDSGYYALDIHNFADGVLRRRINISLEVQAPVSKPAVSQVCLSPDQMLVSCFCEGDGVEFSLTLNGQSLTQTRAGSTDEQHKPNVTISLYSNSTGTLTCNVHNNVSRSSQLGPIAIIVSVACLLLLLASSLGIKHLNKKTRTQIPTPISHDIAEDQIVYSDIEVIKPARDTRDMCYDITEDETVYSDVRATKPATENRHNWHRNLIFI